jgi:hypothetical protein
MGKAARAEQLAPRMPSEFFADNWELRFETACLTAIHLLPLTSKNDGTM